MSHKILHNALCYRYSIIHCHKQFFLLRRFNIFSTLNTLNTFNTFNTFNVFNFRTHTYFLTFCTLCTFCAFCVSITYTFSNFLKCFKFFNRCFAFSNVCFQIQFVEYSYQLTITIIRLNYEFKFVLNFFLHFRWNCAKIKNFVKIFFKILMIISKLRNYFLISAQNELIKSWIRTFNNLNLRTDIWRCEAAIKHIEDVCEKHEVIEFERM